MYLCCLHHKLVHFQEDPWTLKQIVQTSVRPKFFFKKYKKKIFALKIRLMER